MKILTKKYFSNWLVGLLIFMIIAMIGINMLQIRNFNVMLEINTSMSKIIDQYESILLHKNTGKPL